MSSHSMQPLGFIISRHIADRSHADLCFRAYTSIRKFYPSNLVVIIDDGSLVPDPHVYDAQTLVIPSMVPRTAEFGMYYHFHTLRLFERAVLMHDSMVIHRPLEIPDSPVSFLWHFGTEYTDEIEQDISLLIQELAQPDLTEKYKKRSWTSMFGCCCTLTLACLDNVVAKRDLFRLLPMVNSRLRRCAMERVLGIVFSFEQTSTAPSLNGRIFDVPQAFHRDYLLDNPIGFMDKTWHGRKHPEDSGHLKPLARGTLVPPMRDSDQLYLAATQTPSGINEHIERMRDLARECAHITEMGSRAGISTIAWVAARPQRLVCYDTVRHEAIDQIESAARADGVDFVFHVEDVRYVSIEPTDLLFIDTLHVYEQLKAELALHADKVRKYIVLHDTVTFGDRGGSESGEIPGTLGLWPAIFEFLKANRGWVIREHRTSNNGLTVLARA